MRTVWTLVLLVGCSGGDAPDDGTGTDTGTVVDSGDDTGTPSRTNPSDRDGDGYPSNVDCDDTRASVNPGVAADVCNGLDDDCDGDTDEDPDLVWFRDGDADGFGEEGGGSYTDCDASEGFVPNDADCDDDDATIFPGADEICDRLDDDCDGEVDEDPSTWSAWPADADNDGAGSPTEVVYGCFLPDDGADNTFDCNDDSNLEPVWVSPSGRSNAAGTSADPVRDIQTGITYARECVVVLPGTYDEDLDFGGKAITVLGSEGSASTTIRGTGANPVVTFDSGESTESVLEGFTLTGGGGVTATSTYEGWDGSQYYYYDYYYWYGGGVYISQATPTLRDVVIEDNALPDEYGAWTSSTTYVYEESQGGGLYIFDGGAVLEDVHILDNNAAWGAGIYATSLGELTGTRVEVAGNTGQYPTLCQDGGSLDFEAYIVNAESTDYAYGGLYTNYGTTVLRNGVLVSNDYGIYNYASSVELADSVVAGNTYGLYDADSSSSTWTISYTDIYGNGTDFANVADVTGLDGNVEKSPGFVAWYDDAIRTNDDFHLTSSSRLLDAGSPTSDRDDADGTRNDMGAYGGPEGAGW